MKRKSTVSKRRDHVIGTYCSRVRPPNYTVRVVGGPGKDQRFCCVKGYTQHKYQTTGSNP